MQKLMVTNTLPIHSEYTVTSCSKLTTQKPVINSYDEDIQTSAYFMASNLLIENDYSNDYFLEFVSLLSEMVAQASFLHREGPVDEVELASIFREFESCEEYKQICRDRDEDEAWDTNYSLEYVDLDFIE